MKNIIFANTKVYTIFIIISALSFTAFSQKVTIQRKIKTEPCIMGYLLVNDEVVCYTLELGYTCNINDVSAIPAGTYPGKIRSDGDKGWRIELTGVPNRKEVQIHVGNYTTEIRGCTLIGTEAKIDDCTVLNSKAARTKVQNAFLQYLEKDITMIFKDI